MKLSFVKGADLENAVFKCFHINPQKQVCQGAQNRFVKGATLDNPEILPRKHAKTLFVKGSALENAVSSVFK